ncbi:alanine--tRNA ligase [Litoribacillus peritrichatus]|uniref:Alanine--tRNA ligase n=1 Tax=Litoribacillus peritrichatus TaxID=718191 RepID=A0ABP7N9G8_9GAMM
MKSSEIRQAFLEYFNRQQHEVVNSSPLIPGNDPTVMFTVAGMVQFKDCFLGKEKRSYTRATTSQKCLRAGGKHNDLENVGFTARHHTFFEMLGNFSFGDYFKEDAIKFAWEFLTSSEWMNIPKDKLIVTVYEDDSEAYALWNDKMGVPADRIIRIGDKGEKYNSDNFWAMGDTGPCGPCTEIFYDHGPEIWGGPPGSPEEDGDRFVEIWNLVFMQYNRTADGVMEPLPKPSVDTGMGLERISACLQGVHSNYEIDLFQHLLNAAAKILNVTDTTLASLRVIADHIRACSFMISDGIVPSKEGRGYVLRRIVRRAALHGHKLGATEAFFYKLVPALTEIMGEAYPELVKNQKLIEKELLKEEEKFAETLEQGVKIFDQATADLKGSVIPGETVFKLYDTYGFPVDLTAMVARDRDLTIDEEGFEKAMNEQRERARAASKFSVDLTAKVELEKDTEFTGYTDLDGQSKVVALLKDGAQVSELNDGDSGIVVLETTPFYAESGGQVGDSGELLAEGVSFAVTDTQKDGANHLHVGLVEAGTIKVGHVLGAKVNKAARAATELNHSATHLLHAVLREVLGDHVAQKGSLVDAEKLRFDFSHSESISAQQLAEIETRVNTLISANTDIVTEVMDIDSAKEKGAMALFGEKYDDTVRVLSMAEDYSIELCGGTHAKRTGDIGILKITSESGIAAGVRRIEAVTGMAAYQRTQESDAIISEIAGQLKGNRDSAFEKVQQLVAKARQLEKELEQAKAKLASSAGNDLAGQAVDVAGVKLLATKLDGADPKGLRDLVDQLKNKLQSGIVLLAAVNGEKVSLIAGVTKDLTGQAKAGDLIKLAAEKVGGKGGGRPDMAQAGGSDPSGVNAALELAKDWVAEKFA